TSNILQTPQNVQSPPNEYFERLAQLHARIATLERVEQENALLRELLCAQSKSFEVLSSSLQAHGFHPRLCQEDYPRVRFWKDGSWPPAKGSSVASLSSRTTKGTDKAVRGYLEDENGNLISRAEQESILESMRSVWRDLLNNPNALPPLTWGGAGAEARKKLCDYVIPLHPILALCQANWKVNSLATKYYPSWVQNHIPEDVKVRIKAAQAAATQAVKAEPDAKPDPDAPSADASATAPLKRRRDGPNTLPESSAKKQKTVVAVVSAPCSRTPSSKKSATPARPQAASQTASGQLNAALPPHPMDAFFGAAFATRTLKTSTPVPAGIPPLIAGPTSSSLSSLVNMPPKATGDVPNTPDVEATDDNAQVLPGESQPVATQPEAPQDLLEGSQTLVYESQTQDSSFPVQDDSSPPQGALSQTQVGHTLADAVQVSNDAAAAAAAPHHAQTSSQAASAPEAAPVTPSVLITSNAVINSTPAVTTTSPLSLLAQATASAASVAQQAVRTAAPAKRARKPNANTTTPDGLCKLEWCKKNPNGTQEEWNKYHQSLDVSELEHWKQRSVAEKKKKTAS
ncbi:hypothetical protein EXIGLDRAFT_784389, partial [Exidia glandulosa HHB12029]